MKEINSKTARKIIRLRAEDSIPAGATFLHSASEHDHNRTDWFWAKKPGAINQLASLFFLGTETLHSRTPVATFFYYEVPDNGS